MVLPLWPNGYQPSVGQENCGQHYHLGPNTGGIARKSSHHSWKMSWPQYHHLPRKAGTGEGNNFRRSHHQSSRHQTGWQQIQSYCWVANANKRLSQLWSFRGLANQLTAFAPDLAHMAAALRPLLKKIITWTWTSDMDKQFEKVKLLLTTTRTIQPFNPALNTILMTDASRLYGNGFALLQPLPKEKWSLFQSGSASLMPTQTRYATIELKCMAIQWAIQKCSYCLRGLETFQVWTNHKPLVGIFQKSICYLLSWEVLSLPSKSLNFKEKYSLYKVIFCFLLYITILYILWNFGLSRAAILLANS